MTRKTIRSSRLHVGADVAAFLSLVLVSTTLGCTADSGTEPAGAAGMPTESGGASGSGGLAGAGTAGTAGSGVGGSSGSGGTAAGASGTAGAGSGGVAAGGSSGIGGTAGTSGGASGAGQGGFAMGGGGGVSGGGAGAGGASGGQAGGGQAGGGSGGGSGFDPCPATGDCKVLPLGDSITFGTPTNNGGYRVELFTKAVGDSKHITFVGSQSNGPSMVAGTTFPKANEGHPGWTISQIDGISTSSQALKDSPEIILLHIGTNDMVQGANGAPDRLGTLIDKLVAALPDSLLVVTSIIPLPLAASSVMTYNATIPATVKQRADAGKHVMYLEMFDGFPSNGLSSDNVHPNDNVGYPWMGDAYYEAIKQYLH